MLYLNIIRLATFVGLICAQQLLANGSARPSPVVKHVLDNGMTVLVRPVDTTQKVAIQIWYGVGSKHEATGEKGIAHLIEHMLFKGTQKLSETDISLIGEKFSAHFNAATSYDYTTMIFDFPLESWKIAFPLLADCMQNCTFKEEFLNSELKAVVQELKLYRDDYPRTLILDLLTVLYPDHPYHYPVIGYKQDLWNVQVQTLKDFYKKHYVPNNATLVVVGKVDPQEVIRLAQENFGQVPANPLLKKPEFYLNRDLRTQTVTLYRDVHQPQVMLAFSIPGIKEENTYTYDILDDILTGGKPSRLHKKLIDDLELIDSLKSFIFKLHDIDIYAIMFQPRSLETVDQIINILHEELADIARNGCKQEELKQATTQFEAAFYELLENNVNQAHLIGEYYLATGNENYIYSLTTVDLALLNEKIKQYVSSYLRPAVTNKGFILPLPREEELIWKELQDRSDAEDARILAGRVRTVGVEPGNYVNTLESPAFASERCYPKPHDIVLSNGLRVLYQPTNHVPIIKLRLKTKMATIDYEVPTQPGLFRCLEDMLYEGGTQERSAEEFSRALKGLGVTLSVSSGSFYASLMSKDLPQFLQLLHELITQPAFSPDALPKIKAWMLADYKNFWDDAHLIAGLLRKQLVFKDHPSSVNHLADPDLIEKITLEDVKAAYKAFISPHDATLVLVGDLGSYENLEELLEEALGSWTGQPIPDKIYPPLSPEQAKAIYHYLNRDQTVITLVGPSVNRLHPDYDALSLYDRLLFKRLFDLREQTGAFYAIVGSVIAGASEQPGFAHITTIVSNDRLDEVHNLLKDFIERDSDLLTEQDLETARYKISEQINQDYATNNAMTGILGFLAHYKLPLDYFDKRIKALSNITVDRVKEAVKKVFNIKTMNAAFVGRVGTVDECVEEDLESVSPIPVEAVTLPDFNTPESELLT